MKYLILSLLSFSALAFRAEPTPEELAKLKNGEQVERVETHKDQVFPKVTLMTVIPHSPKENMDVFADFEHHKDFIPDLVKSKIVRKVGNETDVDFEMHLPMPVSNSKYTTKHVVEKVGNDYILTWSLVKSEQIKSTDGNVIFEEFEGKTLFTYINQVTPKSKMAWMVKGKVVPDIKKNVKVIIEHLDKTIKK
jgi:Polyketide cyclase / dehydrase and lipid transport